MRIRRYKARIWALARATGGCVNDAGVRVADVDRARIKIINKRGDSADADAALALFETVAHVRVGAGRVIRLRGKDGRASRWTHMIKAGVARIDLQPVA